MCEKWSIKSDVWKLLSSRVGHVHVYTFINFSFFIFFYLVKLNIIKMSEVNSFVLLSNALASASITQIYFDRIYSKIFFRMTWWNANIPRKTRFYYIIILVISNYHSKINWNFSGFFSGKFFKSLSYQNHTFKSTKLLSTPEPPFQLRQIKLIQKTWKRCATHVLEAQRWDFLKVLTL